MLGVVRAGARCPVCLGPGIGQTTCASGSALPMSGPHVMPPLGCENDPAVRPPPLLGTRSGSQRPPPRASSSPGLPVTTRSCNSSRDLQEWQRQADPAFGRPNSGAGQCVFSDATALASSLLSMDPSGKADRPMPAESENKMGLFTAKRFSTCRQRPDSSRRREPRAGLCPRRDPCAQDADTMRRSGVHGGLANGWQGRPRVPRHRRARDTGYRLEDVCPKSSWHRAARRMP